MVSVRVWTLQLSGEVAQCKPISNMVDSMEIVACSFIIDSVVKLQDAAAHAPVSSTRNINPPFLSRGRERQRVWGGGEDIRAVCSQFLSVYAAAPGSSNLFCLNPSCISGLKDADLFCLLRIKVQ